MDILTEKTISHIFPIKGFDCKSVVVGTQADCISIDVTISNGIEDKEFALYVPAPIMWVHERPIFDVQGTYKAIAISAVPKPEFAETKSFLDMTAFEPLDTIAELMRRAITRGVVDGDVQTVAQRSIDTFFSSSDLMRAVDPHKPLDIEAGVLTVVIQRSVSTDWTSYKYKDWVGIVDMISGTQGDKIGHTFKLAEGCKIVRGRFKRSNKLFSGMMRRCIVLPDNDRPNRLMISRPAFASHEELLHSEQPLVVHKSYAGEFKGRHLLTGIMTHPDNYQDCIVISQDAAEKLMCIVRKRVTLQDTSPIHPQVKEGDTIYGDGAILALIMQKGFDFDMVFNPYTQAYQWDVTKVEHRNVMIASEEGVRYRFHLQSHYPCSTGDKLTTRHGGKGIVKIIPTHKMPMLKDGRRLEVLVHPMSFNSRRHLGTFREMMINLKYWDKYQGSSPVLLVDHFSSAESMEQLVSEGWGETQALKNGEQVFAAPLYWLRTDKHACEMTSCVSDEIHVNKDGLKIDKGSMNGKRGSMNYFTILQSRQMPSVIKALVEKNMLPSTAFTISRLCTALSQ